MTGQGGVPGLVTREHALVRLIDEWLGKEAHKPLLSHPRVKSLAEMLRRHGLLQVVTFLRAKQGEDDGTDSAKGDKLLFDLLEKVLEAELGQVSRPPGGQSVTLDARGLAGLGERSAVEYLYLNELAIQAATWIQRLAAARAVLDEQRGRQQEGR